MDASLRAAAAVARYGHCVPNRLPEPASKVPTTASA
jgi:hypothetical protein